MSWCPGPVRQKLESGFRQQRLSALSVLVYLSNKMASLPFMGHWPYDRYFTLSFHVRSLNLLTMLRECTATSPLHR